MVESCVQGIYRAEYDAIEHIDKSLVYEKDVWKFTSDHWSSLEQYHHYDVENKPKQAEHRETSYHDIESNVPHLFIHLD